ncbi:MAG: flagellar type III secretion system pore protein FliP [Planctomycetaceae bacterium]
MKYAHVSSRASRSSRVVGRGACLLGCIALAGGMLWAQPPAQRNMGRAKSNASQPIRTVEHVEEPVPERLAAREPADDLNAADVHESAQRALPGGWDIEKLLSPSGLGSTLQVMMLMTVLSLAPSILIMTTCFVRFAIVLGLLRQALGTQQLPPNQVLMGLCLLLTSFVMAPVWKQSYEEGIRPYTEAAPGAAAPSLPETFAATVGPIRQFMGEQIDQAGNGDTVWMLLDHERHSSGSLAEDESELPPKYTDLPLPVLASAYILSELKVAFLIGFKIFLPFLIIDLVAASLLTGAGLMMLPPTVVSFPFKLLLFVLIDGWSLTVESLLASVRPPA